MTVNLRSASVTSISLPDMPSTTTMYLTLVGKVGSPGLAMGPMGITYAEAVIQKATLNYKPTIDRIVTVELI